jgi:hypothetical protein
MKIFSINIAGYAVSYSKFETGSLIKNTFQGQKASSMESPIFNK